MADSALVDSLGLSLQTLFPSLGKTAQEKFSEIENILSKNTVVNTETLAAVAEGFKLWCIACQLPTKPELLTTHAQSLFTSIVALTIAQDAPDGAISTAEGASPVYRGEVYVAHVLTEALDTVAKMDTTENLLSCFAPLAFAAIEAILTKPNLAFSVKTAMEPKDTIDTYRNDVLCSLLSIFPCHKETKLPIAISVINRILHGTIYPEEMKNRARTVLIALGTIDRDSIVHASSALMEMFKADITGDVLQVYITVPEVYFNNPSEVHNNLPLFLQREYHLTGLLFKFIADRHPEVLAPHLSFFVDKISQPSFGALSLHIVSAIATINPDMVYPLKTEIMSRATQVPSNQPLVATVLSQIALSTNVAAADEVFVDLLAILESCPDTSLHASILHVIVNVISQVSSLDLVKKEWVRLAPFRAASEVIYQAIENYVTD